MILLSYIHTCVLRYIENEDKRFQTFVANRIATIHEASSPDQWRYVNTQLNPADDASRGVSADSLHRWIHGPEFLIQPTDEWPQRPADMIALIPDDDPEVKAEIATYSTRTATRDPVAEITEKFSSWSHLKKVVAWILRYKTNLYNLVKNERREEPPKSKSRSKSSTISPISVTELKNAESAILQYIQNKSFKQEYDQLKRSDQQSSTRNHSDLSKSSSIYKLDPVLVQGLLRVGGRLNRAPLNADVKHPIILPKGHHVVQLIIQYYHHVSGHSGVEYTLSLIRQKYWIISARSTVRKVLEKCFACRKQQAPTGQQKTADLPEDRVTPSKPPFTYTGVDCFGPFEDPR